MMYGDSSKEYQEWVSKLMEATDEAKLKIQHIQEAFSKLAVIPHGFPLHIIPINFIKSGMAFVQGDKLYVSDQDMYKWIFLNVTPENWDQTLDFAAKYAKRKIDLFIDNLVNKLTDEKNYTIDVDGKPIKHGTYSNNSIRRFRREHPKSE